MPLRQRFSHISIPMGPEPTMRARPPDTLGSCSFSVMAESMSRSTNTPEVSMPGIGGRTGRAPVAISSRS